MIKNQRWLNGPDFLLKEEQHWPLPPVVLKGPYLDVLPDTLQSDPEVKKVVQSYSIVEKDCVKEFLSIYSGTSVHNPSQLWKLQRAERDVIKYTQRPSFRNEIAVLEAHADDNRRTTKKSKKVPKALHKLSPILVDGILRVGGHLENAPIQLDIKHPIILPSDHQVTRLLIEHHHLKLMGELPAERVTPEKPPFTYVGVDYFSPLYVKQGRSHVKRYVRVFTCLTMRAIHIEIAHSLDTDAFINALRRFISRRGTPEKIRSDNGTNFTDGERELRESIASLNEQKFGDYLHQRGIEWQFNPPTASQRSLGGDDMLSVRKILKNLLQEQVVCDEVLLTLIAEVEAILNARPLTQLSLDPRDEEPLTPD
ncbi:uncharacterized protein LOC119739081 [Patiria miniata]|uniref:Integrase catalytic domain-containing protein n=1 Tax=Patiria miniata TaxID=46514 RepID=A0A914B228_PATMI|nr:uncharacterized protein LOC119739081 [Patiria miniata]